MNHIIVEKKNFVHHHPAQSSKLALRQFISFAAVHFAAALDLVPHAGAAVVKRNAIT